MPIAGSRDGVYEFLNRCKFSTIDQHQLVKGVEQRISGLISKHDGSQVDPEQARLLLEGFAWSRLGQTIRDSDVVNELHEHGYGIRTPANRNDIRQRMRNRSLAFADFKERSLINGTSIPRMQVEEIVGAVIASPGIALVTGGAGSGKSCTLAQIVRRFIQMDIDCVAFSAADLRGVFSLSELGQRMGMKDSPAI